MADNATNNPTPVLDEGIKPYKIHIPSKHLDLTRQKLELTRLPHQGPEPQIEPLIDYWLESYDFRTVESGLNTNVPQFRTALPLSSSSNESIRLHFIHSKSPSASATPLLILPPFPLTNFSLVHLLSSSFTSEFHFIIPAYPGTGFSDSLPSSNNTPIATTGFLLNGLMTRLGYTSYLTTVTSPYQVDNLIAQSLSAQFPETCIGSHLINPTFLPPSPLRDPWGWSKYQLARFMRGGIWGYEEEDFQKHDSTAAAPTLENGLELSEPDTISYALCDSPVGTLSAVLKGLKPSSSSSSSHKFTEEEFLTMTNLAWLPGPEGAVRYAVGARLEHSRTLASAKNKTPAQNKKSKKQRGKISVTVISSSHGKKRPSPPAWGNNTLFSLSHTQRIRSSAAPTNGLLLSFEKPEIVLDGIKGLLKKLNLATGKNATTTAPLEGVIIHPATEPTPAPGEPAQKPMEMSVISSPASGDTAVAPLGSTPSPSPGGEAAGSPLGAARTRSPSVRIVEPNLGGSGGDVKGKGKAKASGYLEPPAPVRGDSITDGESPDTLVENSPPPPFERT